MSGAHIYFNRSVGFLVANYSQVLHKEIRSTAGGTADGTATFIGCSFLMHPVHSHAIGSSAGRTAIF